MWRSGLSFALLGFRYDPDELVAATDALPVWTEVGDATPAENHFTAIGLFKEFVAGFSVDDADYLSAAVWALAGFAGYCGDGFDFLVHGAWCYKVIILKKTAGRSYETVLSARFPAKPAVCFLTTPPLVFRATDTCAQSGRSFTP